MGSKTVPADAEDYRSGGGDLGVNVAKLANLVCSAGGIIFGIKKQNNFLAKVIVRGYRLAAGGLQREFRGHLPDADFAHRYLSFSCYFQNQYSTKRW